MSTEKNDERLVIPTKRLPMNIMRVVWGLGLIWMYLDRYHSPVWAISSAFTLGVILLIVCLVRQFQQIEKDPMFKPETQEEKDRYAMTWGRNKISS